MQRSRDRNRGSLWNTWTVVMAADVWQMSVQGCFPAGPRTGQKRTMTASRRRQDLAIGALPRRIHLKL
jgi:hypothetical protein